MSSVLLLVLLSLPQQQSVPVELTAVTLPLESDVDVPLIPSGEAEARGDATGTRLRIRVDRTDVLTAFGPTLPAIVAWAVTPEGEFRNLGELEIDGRRAGLDTATSFHRFGILVTAEPHHLVSSPGASVALKSGPPRDDDIRTETLSIAIDVRDYSDLPAPPPGAPSRVAQAHLAFSIADRSGAATLAPAELRTARVALDSMQELSARGLSMELLSPYINDAIRLAQRAAVVAGVRASEEEMQTARRRIASLERELEDARQQARTLTRRQEEAEARQNEILGQLQEARDQNRQFRLENDDLERRLRQAEGSIADLSDPWPPLRTALTRIGARDTALGMVLTLPGGQFADEGELGAEAVAALERVIGVLALGDLPEIRVDGHAPSSGDETLALAESEEMAQAIKDYLVAAGIPDADVQTVGLGSARPLAGGAEADDPDRNRRVEIIFRPGRR